MAHGNQTAPHPKAKLKPIELARSQYVKAAEAQIRHWEGCAECGGSKDSTHDVVNPCEVYTVLGGCVIRAAKRLENAEAGKKWNAE